MKPENNFTEVTFAGDDNQQIKAHRVIFSAGSRFFRDLFINAKHPFVYLSGVGKNELTKIVEFLNNGQTNVDKNDIEKFIESSYISANNWN